MEPVIEDGGNTDPNIDDDDGHDSDIDDIIINN